MKPKSELSPWELKRRNRRLLGVALFSTPYIAVGARICYVYGFATGAMLMGTTILALGLIILGAVLLHD